MIAVGCSTGGPHVLKSIFSRLDARFNLPILLVQHIAGGFVNGFADWLAESCRRPVMVGGAGVVPEPGSIYLAPDEAHMGLDGHGRISLYRPGVKTGLCPSVNYLFQSVAASAGPRAVGIILTGMGRDGAEGLKEMKERGALTIAQDKESAIVYGMPGEAVKLGAADLVLAPERIAAVLNGLAPFETRYKS
jgi:two-component system chemotaxis response regulator CheB